ncbi:NACHT domain-containing protein [Catellatospora bangladeshensis]|uniref:NACHT domain-containing protein n=1 Tax=Catellatospora bangladeshensis TaxID=310355 RepID=UPI003620579E
MGLYQYETLGDDDFQRLIQALLARSSGHRFRAMPLNKADGGRDAVNDAVVFQVKFTGTPERVDDRVDWLVSAIDGEQEKIKRLAKRGCREYVLATNVGGTGGLDKGTIDKLDRELAQRASAWGLDNITAWWRDDVDARFAVADHATKVAFLRALPADEALAITLIDRSQSARASDLALSAYLAYQFEVDNKVRFEQVDLSGPTVDRLFVDVAAASGTPNSVAHSLLAELGQRVDDHDSGTHDQPVAGAARLLLHPKWRGNALIIGGPGQGKTTLLQYICQAHRARQLNRDDYQQSIPQQHLKALVRVPLRVDLREYASWRGKPVASPPAKKRSKQKKQVQVTYAIEIFLAEKITEHSGGIEFKVEDLASLVASRPVLLALDGLDEVADLTRRHEVAAQIAAAATRLQQNAADIMILVTTRPGASISDVLTSEHFPTLHMQRLTTDLRLGYLGRWAQQAGLHPDQVNDLRNTFIEKQSLPHVRELSSNPMQLAILLHLMQRRGILPEQRTELYSDYVKTFLDREAPKEPVVRLHRPIVEDVHAYLAWHLQSESERGRSNGALTADQLQQLLDEHLRDRGNRGQLVHELFKAITGRVICLVERPAGIEFEVQPLREYFAARYLHDDAPLKGEKNTKDDRLDALLRRPYWSNVLRFFAGMLSKGEVRGLPPIFAAFGKRGLSMSCRSRVRWPSNCSKTRCSSGREHCQFAM